MAETFDYQVIELVTKDRRTWQQTLTRLGQDGWQMTGTVPLLDIEWGATVTKNVVLFFMRPRAAGAVSGQAKPPVGPPAFHRTG